MSEIEQFGGDIDQAHERRCADGCGRTATAERFDAMQGEHVMVELWCGRPFTCWLLGWVRWTEPAWWRL